MEYFGFVNLTPFAAQPLVLSDERGTDVFSCVVKASFDLVHQRDATSAAIADEQAPVCLEPMYNGDPGVSSVKYDLDTAPRKVGTDVVLVGHAYATAGRATWLDVSVTVGPARSVVRVFGDRVWTAPVGRWVPSPPQPFERMPLVYERAFGGWDRTSPDPAEHEFDPRNPVGVGFVSKKHGVVREGSPLPNLENPYEPIASPTDRPQPVGFGFIGAHWQPRASFAGTYDARWEKERMPLLPEDFNPRFYNAANPALTFQGFLRGGEPVAVTNASPRGTLGFALPALQPYGTIRLKDGTIERFPMTLDTVVLNTDEEKLFLAWRGSLPIQKRLYEIAWAKAQLAPNASVTT